MIGLGTFAFSITAGFATTSAMAQYVQPWSPVEAATAAGQEVFRGHCAACHVRQPGASGAFAPSLVGVFGRQAGSQPGFPYSSSLKNSGIVWTEKNLLDWIADGTCFRTR